MGCHPVTHEVVAFRMKALRFGAVRSVHDFHRTSYSLWYVRVNEFLVLTANYFDNSIMLATAPEMSAVTVTSCVQMCFRLLGLDFAETGPKASDFAVFL